MEEPQKIIQPKEADIEAVVPADVTVSKVKSVVLTYLDGSQELFKVGDKTTIGTIIKFEKKVYWYALLDQPSEWHLQNGMKNNWNWVCFLQKI